MKIKHEGLSTHRLKSNPREHVFAEAWKELNGDFAARSSTWGVGRHSTLEHILCSNADGNVTRDLSQMEATTAATVIQWLGSPVGWSWLTETIKKANGS